MNYQNSAQHSCLRILNNSNVFQNIVPTCELISPQILEFFTKLIKRSNSRNLVNSFSNSQSVSILEEFHKCLKAKMNIKIYKLYTISKLWMSSMMSQNFRILFRMSSELWIFKHSNVSYIRSSFSKLNGLS